MQNETLKTLVEWRASLEAIARVEKFYIFGSLINDKGRDFDSHNSDIDLVVVFNQEADILKNRIESLQYLEKRVDDLESAIIKLLKRDAHRSHTSLVCLTGIEGYHGIHKSLDFKLLSERQFIEIRNGVSIESDHVAITLDLDEPAFRTECGDAISAVAFAQETRNKFLSNSFNTSSRGLNDYADSDPMPKKMMRTAAMLGWRAFGEEERKRTDLAVGMRYLQKIIADQATNFEDLHRKLEGRLLGRGKPAPISRIDQVIISELLFEAARGQLVSRRSKLDSIISGI